MGAATPGGVVCAVGLLPGAVPDEPDDLARGRRMAQSEAMTTEAIQAALGEIGRETDPAAKHLKLASLVSAVFRQRGIELVVVGGSAIEFYTDGEYVSGDLDLCLVSPARIDLRTRQERMGLLQAAGGPRSWQVAGQYVDLLGEVETLAKTPFAELTGPYGPVRLISPEDLLVERLLISIYPQPYAPADHCARKLLAVALCGQVEVDWAELRRLAAGPAFDILPLLLQRVGEISNELGTSNPYHSEGTSP
ncbi:MAG: hypothetical protein KF833_09915 [Verrucomicrobiae bacterium]|nr:hypothetical protein [Verrucomicrobiae bacterium]